MNEQSEQPKPLPFISILVMSHNRQDYIGANIDSLLAQRYDGPLEIVFCDDCSSDATFDIIEERVRAYRGPHRIITHRCPVNGRVAVNMNVAVSLSHGDWLMRVDDDDIQCPDRVRLTAEAILRHPRAMAVSGCLAPFTNTPQSVSNPPPEELEYDVADAADFRNGQKPDWLEWWGGMSCMKRELWTAFGDMPAVCDVLDDTMFAARALMLGQFVRIRNAVLIHYRRHSGNISSDQGAKPRSLREAIKADAANRDYYRRGLRCHGPILAELDAYAATHPDCAGLSRFFHAHFEEMRRQALFWEKPWRERIADAHIRGGFLRKLPWALRVSCPAAYCLAQMLKD